MKNTTLGEQIKKLRTARNLTLNALAKRLDVTTSTVAAYENGTRNPSFDVLIKIASLFNVTVDNLLGYTNKDLIDVTELTNEQRDVVQSMIEAYKRNNFLEDKFFNENKDGYGNNHPRNFPQYEK